MSLPDKLYVWDLAAKPGRLARQHLIPQDNGVDTVVNCGHKEPGEVPIKLAKNFNNSGFKFTEDAAGKKPFVFPVKSNEKDASGGIRLEPGQTIALYSELVDSAVEDRCKMAGIDTDGMKKSEKVEALRASDGISAKKKSSREDDDEGEEEDLASLIDDDDDPDPDVDDDDIVNGAAGD